MSDEKRKILSIVTAITGHQVIIGERELDHALHKHFRIPKLSFYKLDDGGHLVVVVKVKDDDSLFSSIYPTGKEIRKPHKNLKKVKL